VTNAVAGEYIQLPDTKWYRITAVGSNTSLTIETPYLGSTLAGQAYVISPWGEVNGKLASATVVASLTVPKPKYIANYANRVWTLTNNTINFSVLDTSVAEAHFNDFNTANNSGIINLPAGDGDSGTGLYQLKNALYVFQKHAIWAIYGNSPANFELRNITNEIGLLDKRTLVEYNDLLVFLSDQGIILFDGSNIKNVSDGVVQSEINAWANLTSPVATLWENKYLIAYTPSGASYNDEALFYDLTRGVFGKLVNMPAGVFSSWTGGTDSNEIYLGSSVTGNMYKWDIGGNDAGYETSTLFDTASLGFGSGINDKTIKQFHIQQLTAGDWNMTVTQLLDLGETVTTGAAINLSPGSSSLWGVAQWGVDLWSSEGQLTTDRIAEFQGNGKYYKFRIEQSGYNEGIEVLGIVATSRMRRLS